MRQGAIRKIAHIIAVLTLVIANSKCVQTRDADKADRQLLPMIQEQLGDLDYEIEEVPLTGDTGIDRNSIAERQWNIYVPAFDLTYHIWRVNTDTILSWEHSLKTDFNTEAVIHFYEQYGTEKDHIFCKIGESGPERNCIFICTYSDETEREGCFQELNRFCGEMKDYYGFLPGTEWSFQQIYTVRGVDGTDYRIDMQTGYVWRGDAYSFSEGSEAEHHKKEKEYLSVAETRNVLALYADVEEIYPGKTREELMKICCEHQILLDTDGMKYEDLYTLFYDVSIADLYRIAVKKGIPVEGDESGFSFTSGGNNYTFSYRFYHPGDEFYYLKNGEKNPCSEYLRAEGFVISRNQAGEILNTRFLLDWEQD